MKINYSGLIAEEQCMKASSWEVNEPVAHINVVQSLIDRLNDAEESNQKLKEDIEKLKSQIRFKQAELNEARNISDNFAYSIKNLGHYADKAISDYNSSLWRITDGIPVNNIFTAYKKLLDTSS